MCNPTLNSTTSQWVSKYNKIEHTHNQSNVYKPNYIHFSFCRATTSQKFTPKLPPGVLLILTATNMKPLTHSLTHITRNVCAVLCSRLTHMFIVWRWSVYGLVCVMQRQILYLPLRASVFRFYFYRTCFVIRCVGWWWWWSIQCALARWERRFACLFICTHSSHSILNAIFVQYAISIQHTAMNHQSPSIQLQNWNHFASYYSIG